MKIEFLLRPLTVVASLAVSACSSGTLSKAENPSALKESENKVATVSAQANLKDRYERLRHEGDLIKEATQELEEKDRYAVRACQSTHRECVFRTMGTFKQFIADQDTSSCNDISDPGKNIDCKEGVLAHNGKYERLVVLYETSNDCASIIQGCADNLMSVALAAEASDFPLSPNPSVKPQPQIDPTNTHYDRLKARITTFVGREPFDYFFEEICGNRDPEVKATKEKVKATKRAFYSTYKGEIEKCDTHPPRGLEHTEGACFRYVLKKHPDHDAKMGEASIKVDQAFERCLEKIDYQLSP